MGEDFCKACGVRMAHGYESTYCDSCHYYEYKPTSKDLYRAQMERLRRKKYEAVQLAKRKRLEAASMKECAGCEKQSWHDADDYICIVCRDGRNALPDGAYMPGVDAAA
jgi:hypothetical protein